jgi:hypothetical protein
MTSVGSFIKQIPLNNAYFRPQPELAAGLSTIGAGPSASISSYMYSISATGVITTFSPAASTTAIALQAGACLLKDMGTQFLSSQASGNASPIVFRRVQVVDYTNGAGLATDGVSGLSPDYNTAFILMGFNGASPVGPFVRTG